MTITPRLFEAHLKCPTKCWLRSVNEPIAGNTYAEWVETQSECYRTDATNRLTADSLTDRGTLSRRSSRREEAHYSAEDLKTAKWRLAFDVVLRAALLLPRSSRGHEAQTSSPEPSVINPQPSGQRLLTSTNLEPRLHAVERIPSEGRGRAAQFIPIHFIWRNKLTKDDKLVLAFDAFLLSAALDREVSLGKVIHGDDHAVLKVKTSALAGEVRKLLEKIAALLANEKPPDLVLNRHCAECEFQARCRQKAIETDDLSLLAGMSAKERQKFRSKGIFTVTQLSYTFRPRRRPKRLRDKREKYHHALKALAIREKKIHIVGSPELKIEGTPVYLDVEGLPDRDFYYLIGLRIGNGDTAVQHSLWADTVADEGKIWREFLAILETVEKPVLIHYGSYETSFLKRMNHRYNNPQGGASAEKAINSAVNLVSVAFAQIYFPAYSNSLKELSGYLGLNWSEPQASGLTSIVRRHEWENSQIPTAKQKLVTYNSEDCLALQKVTEACLRTGDEANLSKNQVCKDVIDADNIGRKRHFRWSLEEFSVQDFSLINQAAYWDYQRRRVYVKANSLLHRAKQRRKHPLTFDRDVEVNRAPAICRNCGHEQFRKAGSRKKWCMICISSDAALFGEVGVCLRINMYVSTTAQKNRHWAMSCHTTSMDKV